MVANHRLESEIERANAKLAVVRKVSGYRSLSSLVDALPGVFGNLLDFMFIGLSIIDHQKGVSNFRGAIQTAVPQGTLPSSEATDIQEIYVRGVPLADTPVGEVASTGEVVYVPSLETDLRYPRIFGIYRRHGARSLVYIPLKTPRSVIGSFFLSSAEHDAFGKSAIEFLRDVADYLALAVENTLNIEALMRSRQELDGERNQLGLLVRIARITAQSTEVSAMMEGIFREIGSYLKYRFCSVAEHVPESDALRVVYLNLTKKGGSHPVGTMVPLQGTVGGAALHERRTVLYLESDQPTYPWSLDALHTYGMNWLCAVPLLTEEKAVGMFYLGGEAEHTPDSLTLHFVEQIASHVALAMQRAIRLRKMQELNRRLEQENLLLQDEIRGELNFEEIVGRSKRLRDVLQQVEVVAPTDATVLIQGESGTGKELVARAIHRHSPRSDDAFVKVNCSAIPGGLLESELFGHERGAFTGALTQKPGRFEVADGGTIFLDEIGEMPLELQPKLLRVLQEREFERLGSNKTLRTNVRVVAATNRDLKALSAEGKFREDLFYRLSVFPVSMPPLRERDEDIPLLIRYFVEKSSRRLGRQVTRIPEPVFKAMQRYSWPGNVRELENFIERAVILSSGAVLNAPLSELAPDAHAPVQPVTMEDAERQIILKALEECMWIVGGPKGAARRLGMKRTTLQSRMVKLGISRPNR